jgi:Domain of unknown function (DUF4157)
MKWPFARHNSPPAAAAAEPARPEVHAAAANEARPARRDWATLPPLKVAGGRPISLTVHARAFTESLVTRQSLVHSPRLEHVRQIDAPSGSFRGVLAPAIVDHDHGPELQEASPLPAVEHRHLAATTGEPAMSYGQSAIDQLLAIGAPGGQLGGDQAPLERIESLPGDTYSVDTREGTPEPPPTDGGSTGRRRGLADSRRLGLGPAYHGPLPEAMRAERDRDDSPDGRGAPSVEPVPGDVRATMRDILGVDVGDRLVHRGPAVSAEADKMGAQAFTRDGQVYLHDDVGPLDQPRGRATLAHELTHAAQQEVHNVLHDEATEAGRALEAHAQRVEQFVRGDGGAIKPTPDLLHAKPPTKAEPGDTDVVSSAQQMMREMVDSGLAKSDGSGGIIFTMPPSSMTASAGTQRLAGDAPTAHAAASPAHWDPLASLGNTLGQGLANDMLGIAGSMFGFSDEFMGEQRHELSSQDRQFRRDQTTQAYSELRMDHLRRVELTNLNDIQQRHDLERTSELDAETLQNITNRINEEITERLTLLDTQTAAALERLNQQRATRREAALLDVPDPNFTAALTALFDNVDNPVLPSEDELLTTLAAPPTAGGRSGPGARPGGGVTPRPTGAPTGGAPGSHPTGAASTVGAAGTHPTGTAPETPAAHDAAATEGHPGTEEHAATGTDTHPGTGTGTTTGPRPRPGGGTGTGAAAPEQHWRTDATMGGRFSALGDALAGDIAHAELGFFGSLLGFDSAFERDLHGEIDHPATAAGGAAAGGAAGTGTGTGTGGAATTGAAHTDTAHPTAAAHTDAAHPAGHPGAAHQTVESIVDDPYALDELATRLYPTIRSRLRQELLIDRERAGLLADFR